MTIYSALPAGLEPWQIKAIERVNYLRGRIITHYAQCEFLLADVSVKVDFRFVYLLKNRIRAAKEITQRGAPFDRYAEDVGGLCDELARWDDIRNFLVHGFATLEHDPAGNFGFEFRRYERTADEKFQLLIWKIQMPDLEAAADRIGILCGTFMKTFERIYIEQGLEKQFRELF
jgi:hypothetical protein